MSQPRHHIFQTKGPEGLAISYFEWGNADDPTILMIHATGFHARVWDKTIAALGDGYHVIALEMRGHGRSDDGDRITDWTHIADDMEELLLALDLKDMIGVGHSMGGHCLTQLAARHQDRFQRLILIDPVIMDPAHYSMASAAQFGSVDDHPIARRNNDWADPQEMIDRFKDRHPYSLWRPDILEDYCVHGLLPQDDTANGPGRFRLACLPEIEASVYMSSGSINVVDLVGDIHLPVKVLRAKGRDASEPFKMDFALSPTWEGLADAFPNGKDVFLPELTHFMPMQDPALMAQHILDF